MSRATLGCPSNIEVLIWCHCRAEPHPRLDAPAVQEGIKMLVGNGLVLPSALNQWTTTEKGKWFMEYLTAIPLPVEVTTFQIPEA